MSYNSTPERNKLKYELSQAIGGQSNDTFPFIGKAGPPAKKPLFVSEYIEGVSNVTLNILTSLCRKRIENTGEDAKDLMENLIDSLVDWTLPKKSMTPSTK